MALFVRIQVIVHACLKNSRDNAAGIDLLNQVTPHNKIEYKTIIATRKNK